MEKHKKGHSRAKYPTKLNLLMHKRIEERRAIHTKAIKTTTAEIVSCVLLVKDEGLGLSTEIFVRFYVLWATRGDGSSLCSWDELEVRSLCWFHNKAYATSERRTAHALAAVIFSLSRGKKKKHFVLFFFSKLPTTDRRTRGVNIWPNDNESIRAEFSFFFLSLLLTIFCRFKVL